MGIDQIKILLGIAIIIIMLGMGLSLELKDFSRIIKRPKSVIIGLLAQMVILPLIAFLLVKIFHLEAGLAVGIMLIAACPGGAVSNMFTFLAKGDVALSVSLTAFTSFVTIFTVPFFIDFSVQSFLIADGADNIVDRMEFIKVLLLLIAVPVTIGMVIRRFNENIASKSEKPVKYVSVVFLAVIVAVAVLTNKDKLLEALPKVGTAAILLNVSTMAIGFSLAKLSKLSSASVATITIEGGIQNGTLAMTLGTIGILGDYPEILLPAALYSVWMFFSGGIFSYLISKQH